MEQWMQQITREIHPIIALSAEMEAIFQIWKSGAADASGKYCFPEL